MPEDFQFDVFLSHSAKDKAAVRELAAHLKRDGVRVWLDEEQIKPGDSIPTKIEEGLEHSHVLVLCMSANAFGSDWSQLEAGTFRFRDPLNKQRRLIPLRFDDAPLKGSLAQFLYINWLPADRDQEYAKLLEACRPPTKPKVADAQAAHDHRPEKAIHLEGDQFRDYAFNEDGNRILTCGLDHSLRLWDGGTGQCLRQLIGHTGTVWKLSWSADGRQALSASFDKTIRLWDETGRCCGCSKAIRPPIRASLA